MERVFADRTILKNDIKKPSKKLARHCRFLRKFVARAISTALQYMAMLDIRPTPKKAAKPKPRDIRKVVSLADAPAIVVNDGRTLEWSIGNATAEVTPAELEKVSRATGVQNLNPEKVRRIKSMMRTMTCAQIVSSLKGRKGYAERTVKRYHAALSKSSGVVE